MKKMGKRLTALAVTAAAAVMAAALPAGNIPSQVFSGYAVTASAATTWTTLTKFSQLKSAVNRGADHIRLKGDVTVTETLEINKNITIDLNGYRLNCRGECRAFINNRTLTITDNSSGKNGRITGGNAETGGAIYNDGTLYIKAGIIENNEAVYGGAIYNASGAELIISGGKIRNNDASDSGGAVYAESSSTIELKSSSYIQGNSAENGGGIYLKRNAAVTIARGAYVDGNSADSFGGGIYTESGTVTLDGGSITGNSAGRRGGGIYEDSSVSKVTVNSGTFSGNSPQDFNNSDGKSYNKGTVTISFNSNGGSSVRSFTVKSGDYIGATQKPTRDGYNFLGWTLGGRYIDNYTRVSEDVTLVAQWEKKADIYYTVTYDSNGGSRVYSETVKAGGRANIPSVPTRSGYNFTGWYLNGRLYDFSSSVNGNITLVAQWEKKADIYYTVTYDSNGGSRVYSETVKAGGRANIPTVPTRSGYDFTGWYFNGRLYDFSSSVNSNITLVAQWEKQADTYCTVTFRAQGGLFDTRTVKAGSTIGRLPVPESYGYEFVGWTLNGRYVDQYEVIYSDCTLTAEFVEDVSYYTVSIYLTKDELYPLQTRNVREGDVIGNMPSPYTAREMNAEFIGWTTGYSYVDANTRVYSDLVIWGEWNASAYDYGSDFYFDGGYSGGSFGSSADTAGQDGEYSAENSDEADTSGIDPGNIAVDGDSETVSVGSTREDNPKTGAEDIFGAAALSAVFAGTAYIFRRRKN